ncbi:MAG: hypothetical protein KDD40_12715 [Bdellovibrionales bacterium]|nr:hypothetical protein [Bdellovibrionales bacterium]
MFKMCFILLIHFLLNSAFATQIKPNFSKNEFDELSQNAEKIIRFHCGSCHTPNLKTANPKALKVFNFADKPWYQKMTIKQLQRSAKMLQDKQNLTEAELQENFFGRKEVPRRPSHFEVSIYQKFVQEVQEKKLNPFRF